MMLIFLTTLWSAWMIKYVLFWLYLWQLKEYHIGRFVDHFRTDKGKRLLFDSGQFAKLFLLVFLFSNSEFFYPILPVIFFVYVVDLAIFLAAISKKSFKKPVITFKIIFLSLISFAAVILFLAWNSKFQDIAQVELLLAFDILTPLVISIIVLIFQPLFVFVRNSKLKKAKNKLEKIKSVSGLKVIAITGSYGKTSTKEFLSTILSKKFEVLKTNEHQNSEIGVAKCILNDLKPNHQIFIAEVGAYNKGKVKEVCSMLKPKIGIVTGVNQQHMALFGSLENLLSAEGGGELAGALPKDGLLVVNGDNKYCLDLLKKSNNLPSSQEKIYSLDNKKVDSDIWSDSITVHKDHVSFLATNKSGELAHFNVKILGKQNVQNLLGAILIAKELGMSFEEASDACENISQEQAGMVLRRGKLGIEVVDSSYSANPDGVIADLDYLSIFPQKKVIVMPCLIELGEKSSEIHERIGKVCDLAIITSKDKFREIEGGFNETKKPRAKCLLCDRSKDIYSAITLSCKSGDAVLLEGRVPSGLIDFLSK